jgi:hypothetical protein
MVININNRKKLRIGDTLTVIKYEPKKGHEELSYEEYEQLVGLQ